MLQTQFTMETFNNYTLNVGTNTYNTNRLQYGIYFFNPDIIEYEEYTFSLRNKLHCKMEYNENEGLYLITYPKFDINVWGESEEEAKEAFNFSFWALYQTYAIEEDDENLSDKAIELKNQLNDIITVVNIKEENENEGYKM